jgi:hypothetical protein
MGIEIKINSVDSVVVHQPLRSCLGSVAISHALRMNLYPKIGQHLPPWTRHWPTVEDSTYTLGMAQSQPGTRRAPTLLFQIKTEYLTVISCSNSSSVLVKGSARGPKHQCDCYGPSRHIVHCTATSLPWSQDTCQCVLHTSLRWHLDRQVSSVAQVFNALSQMFSAVGHLTLGHEVHSQSSEGAQ